MWYIVTFCIGAFLGMIITAIITVSGQTDKEQEAYNLGYMDGKKNRNNV